MLRLAILASLIAAPALAASPEGYWLTEKKGVIVKLYDCGEALCGQTVWLKKMRTDEGTPRLDARNPDPALRDRHWCGITAITGLKASGEGEWEDGEVYDPKTGSTFDFDLRDQGDTVKVRGYLGIPALGKSETWTRADVSGVELCEG